MEGEEALMSMLNQMVEIAQKEVDIFEFVSEDDLKEHGSARGMWADATPKDNPDEHLILVWVDQDLAALDKIITIAHELGHVRNFVRDFKRNLSLWNLESPNTTLMKEQVAWIYAVDFLKQVEFKNWEYFLDTVSYSIDTYYFPNPIRKKEDFFKELIKKIGAERSCILN